MALSMPRMRVRSSLGPRDDGLRGSVLASAGLGAGAGAAVAAGASDAGSVNSGTGMPRSTRRE